MSVAKEKGKFAWGFRMGLAVISSMLMGGAAPAAPLEYDIVVSGGSFAAVAAAFSAARTNPEAKVLLIEPTDWLGGQATSQGVAAIDNAWHAPAAAIMRENEPLYYPSDYLDWIERMKDAPAEAPGEGYAGHTGWVSRHQFDPRTGAWALSEMASEFPNLTMLKLTVVKEVGTAPVSDAHGEGLRIESLSLIERTPKPGYTPHDDFLSAELPDWYSPEDSDRFEKALHTVVPRDPQRGMVVIEASEQGDVMVLSGARYTQGREVSTERVAEDGTLPEINDDQPKALVYPFVMTTAEEADSEEEIKAPWPGFDDFLAERTQNYFSLGAHSWTRVWTYRRLHVPDGGSMNMDVINPGDVTMQNWHPGNDYTQGPWLLDMEETGAQAASGDWAGGINLETIAKAEKQAVAWYFWLKERLPGGFPSEDTRYLRGGDGLNMMGTAHGLAKFPYIRGTRRLVGLDNFRITGRYWVDTQASGYDNETSFRFFDSIGIGNYAADMRPLIGSTGIAPQIGQPAPFYIPYRALTSHNVRNLLTCGKTMAQTHVTNSAYRLHPIEWASGTAAGAAAMMMHRDSKTNYDLLPIPELRALQALVAETSPIHWEYRGEPVIPPQDGDLVVNGFEGLPVEAPFEVEVYHPTAVRAEILVNGEMVGETTYRANGRLRLEAPGVYTETNPSVVEARCYDGEGNLIATLEATVPLTEAPCEQHPGVTDNDDGEPWFTTTGEWIVADAQPDRWCDGTYHYTDGTGEERTATWRLRTTVSGIYEVAIWYPEASNRATDAPFEVHHAAGVAEHAVNQRVNGGRWVRLGDYHFTGSPDDRVVLRNTHSNSQDLVIADAVRVRLVQPHEESDGWAIH